MSHEPVRCNYRGKCGQCALWFYVADVIDGGVQLYARCREHYGQLGHGNVAIRPLSENEYVVACVSTS